MKHILVAFVLLVSVALCKPVAASEQFDIVTKATDEATSASVDDSAGIEFVKRVSPDTIVVSVTADSSQQAAAIVDRRPGTTWAEPDADVWAADARAVDVQAGLSSNDPCFAATCAGRTQTNLTQVRAQQAWDVTTGPPDMTIAVLDSGVDATHPDLAGRVTTGPNFTDDAQNVDLQGHGTHVAGTLGANTNNGIGVAGMVWDADLLAVKVLDFEGRGSLSGVAAGLRWATDNGARLANMSLVTNVASRTLSDAVTYAQSRGVLIVAAAGNDRDTSLRYPAAYPGVVSVAAVNPSDQLFVESNRGTWVDIAAPGVGILSTWPTNLKPGDPYEIISGTSMATPLVAGAAALVWQQRPYLTASGVAERLRETAARVAGSGTFFASGRLDAGAAVLATQQGYRLTASDGGIFSFDRSFSGSTGNATLNQPIVTATTPGTQDGYWLVAADGGVFSFGGAEFFGSAGGIPLNQPIVSASSTSSGNGYWLVARDGGVFSYGDANFYGSTGGQRLNQPITAFVPTATGRGYWLIAADGGVFSFGDASFFGSTGANRLNAPIVGAARSASGDGYWLVAADGGIFAFGDARFFGSAGSIRLQRPIVGMSTTSTGNGYHLSASDGGVFSYGDAQFKGSTGGQQLNRPIVSISGAP